MRLFRAVVSTLAIAIVSILAAAPVHAATLTIAWDADADPAVTGYVISYGQQPGVYVAMVDAGNQTLQSIAGLTDGATYYFAVQAYDGAGLRSGYSPEVSGTTPVAPPPPPPPPPPGAPGVPALVAPPSASIGVATSTSLTWSAAANAQQYDVALGVVNPPAIVSAGLASTAYQPPVALVAGTTYFWQITADGPGGSTASPVWSFTTAAASAPTTSPDGTLITAGGQIIDAGGASWTIGSNLAILRNGLSAASGYGSKILWLAANIYVLGTDANWYQWNATGSWTNVGPTQPTAPAGASASPDGTLITVGGQIVDAGGAVWTIASNVIMRNGMPAANGIGSKILWWSANIYVLGSDANWYQWNPTGSWTNVGATQPNASAPVAPSVPVLATPLSGATNVATLPALAWQASANATQYDVALSVTNPPAVVSSNQSATTYAPVAALAANTTYFWQVVAKGPGGTTPSPIWSFTTVAPPTAPSGPAPANAASGVLLTAAVSWTPSSGAAQYDVAFGTLNPPPVVSGNQAGTSYQPTTLATGTTYYWQVTAKGAGGSTSGPIWSFATVTAPSVPSGPMPANLATVDTSSASLSWNASTDATQYDIAFGATNPPATIAVGQAATAYQVTSLQRGMTYYWQIIAKGSGGATPGPVWRFTTPAGVPTATFVGVDSVTQGTWKNLYGRDGYTIAADATTLPSYVTLSQAGQLLTTWASSTTDPRALQKSAATDRIAAAWYGGQFSFDLDFVDGNAHDVDFYLLDWDQQSRNETIALADPFTGAVLDARTVSGFGAGQHWVWHVSGHVTVIATANTATAVISGMFFDSIGGPANLPPTVALTSPTTGATFTAPATIPLTVAASDADGVVEKVDVYAGATWLGTLTTAPYAANWSNVPAGTYSFTAVATDNFGATTTSAPVQVTVKGAAPKTTAAFLGMDATTQGTWKGKYGSSGYALANDASNLPAYASVSLQGMLSWTYTTSTTAVRALEKATQTGRMAADWYGNTFTIDVNLQDGLSHKLSFYLLDWDTSKRKERIDILDAVTGAVLSSQSPSRFQNGQYWSWTVSGHVLVRFTNAGSPSPSAVVSGLFFDQ